MECPIFAINATILCAIILSINFSSVLVITSFQRTSFYLCRSSLWYGMLYAFVICFCFFKNIILPLNSLFCHCFFQLLKMKVYFFFSFSTFIHSKKRQTIAGNLNVALCLFFKITFYWHTVMAISLYIIYGFFLPYNGSSI